MAASTTATSELVMCFLLSLQCHGDLCQVRSTLGQVRSRECVLSVKLGCRRQLCQVSPPLGHVSRGSLVCVLAAPSQDSGYADE